MICPQCHTDNPEQSASCAECGRALTEAAAPRYPDRGRLVQREIAILFAGIVLVFVAAFGVWYLLVQQRSPEMIVKRFIEADRAGDFGAEEQYVLNSWDSRMVLSALQTFRKQTGNSAFHDYRITGSSISGQTATVRVDIPYSLPTLPGATPPPVSVGPPASQQFTVTFALTRANDEWRIDAGQTAAGVIGVLVALGYQQIGQYLPNLSLPSLTNPFPNPFGGSPLPPIFTPGAPAPAPGTPSTNPTPNNPIGSI